MSLSSQQLWSQVLARLEQQLNRPTFETWIQTTTIKDLQDSSMTICTPNPFVLNHLQKHYLPVINNVVTEILGKPVEIHLTLDRGDNADWISSNLPLGDRIPDVPAHHHALKLTELNPKYTFYRFVVGPTNRMAHAAALAVAESPGRDFNPLFLCGGVGLGKTHLMQAIGHYHREITSEARVFYISTEQFTNDLIAAIRNDNMESFREYYRTADILLVDDIQFIEGKEYTQEEFFHTFNTLHEAGKQVVIASDRPPNKIPKLQERLISRFSMGLIADVQVPDLETRMAILQKKAEYEKIRVPKEAIEYIATRCKSNIRELEGAFIRAIAYLSISGLPMTVDNIAPILNPPVERVVASPEIILQVVTQELKISLEDIKGASRRREISTARQIGMYLMRQHTDLSLPRIGEEFGGKDHTTVMYSCDKIGKKVEKDRELSQIVTQLSDRINFVSKQKQY
ncbi:Chromosomal replication initiator protein DnaA [Hyella patelloides LEGE 07179]|uniref:Chromosomal replication initiator protein DnaA n=1 Tax=Hyella patelloides LEGE 07179 TaxID=945734 RepID=A0A563VPH6_9CYAN|nr:chromosomal replication initiator protein DnaA [Hyella patelloides]VEP13314.1 Chromosomal replication initiator protein DnaA [Hyella patelloides LEGE 07179]